MSVWVDEWWICHERIPKLRNVIKHGWKLESKVKAEQCYCVCTMSSNKILKVPLWMPSNKCVICRSTPAFYMIYWFTIWTWALSGKWQLLPHGYGIEWLAQNVWSWIGTLQFRMCRPKRGYLKPNLRTFFKEFKTQVLIVDNLSYFCLIRFNTTIFYWLKKH